ncbi:MAG: hypothetical protein QOE35_2218 [Actinomycetota bacterium]
MRTHIRPTQPEREPSALRRWFSSLATTRPLLFLSRHISWRLDPVLLRLSGGRIATTLMLPTAVLETRGARTGARRKNAVIYWHDRDRITIAASHGGAPRNPSWYYNLVANPDVTFGSQPMRASVVAEQDRDRLWELGDRVFPAFATYRRQALAVGRTIPLIQLEPRQSERHDGTAAG